MDLKQLTYFVAIVEDGTISGAAQRLHIAQPALSLSLKTMETDLGVPLLERGPRSVRLTEGGRLFYQRARQILDMARSARQELSDVGRGVAGVLRLGTVSSSASALLSWRMGVFHRRYPQVRFELHEGNTFELIEMLRTGILDLAITRTPFKAEGTERFLLEKEPMALAAMGWPQGAPATVLSLKDRPLVYYRRFENLITSVCAQAGFAPYALCVNDDARTCMLWAASGLGTAVVPLSAARLMAAPGMTILPIDHPELYTSIAALWKKDGYHSAAAARFLDIFLSAPSEEFPARPGKAAFPKNKKS